jgi:hypothetical protein
MEDNYQVLTLPKEERSSRRTASVSNSLHRPHPSKRVLVLSAFDDTPTLRESAYNQLSNKVQDNQPYYNIFSLVNKSNEQGVSAKIDTITSSDTITVTALPDISDR